MSTRRKMLPVSLLTALAVALFLFSGGLQGQGFVALNHAFDVDGASATVCTDGAIFDGEATGADSLNLLMTSQVFDSTGTMLRGTGDTNTFTAPGQVYTFTVLYPSGTYAVGETIVLSVSDSPPDDFGVQGDVATTTVADCTLPMTPTLPGWGFAFLALLLVAGGAWMLRSRTDLRARPLLLLAFLALGTAAVAGAEVSTPVFSKAFSPDTIGPGSTAMLIFTVNNSSSGTPAGMLAFDDELPFGMTLAEPPFVSNTCSGIVDFDEDDADSEFDIRLTDGQVGAGQTCTLVVNVIGTTDCGGLAPEEASIAVACENVSGDLTSSAGNSGSASADLFVDHTIPGFFKSFAPDMVELGQPSTLTFTIDNTDNPAAEIFASFMDTLPPGMAIADPANESTTCGTSPSVATITADPGTSVIDFFYSGTFLTPLVGAGASCTVSVDVIGGAVGLLGNVSDNLTVSEVDFAGKASAVLEVTGFDTLLAIQKSFTDDPVAPGGTVNLQFKITNKSRDFAATGITFDDVIDPMGSLTGLTPVLPPTPDPPCGAGSVLTFGSGTLTLSGGNLPAEAMCTFNVKLTVPTGATPGSYPNTTTAISGTIDGEPEMGNVAGDVLSVVAFPLLTKTFLGDPVGAGDTVTLEFTITNTNSSAITDIAFFDELTDGGPNTGFLPYPVTAGLPPMPNPPCGGGSSLSLLLFDTNRERLSLTGGSLAAAGSAGDSCTFTVTVDIPAGLSGGFYTNTTGKITAKVGMTTLTGKRATDVIEIRGAPMLSKEFTDDPALPGGTATLLFTLENLDPDNTATAIAFGDDLDDTLTGLTVASVVTDTCGGTPSGIGTDMFGYAGGVLAPEATCEIELLLDVPDVAGGTFGNETTAITATVGGVGAVGRSAEDDLVVAGLQFSKEFTGEPVIAGDTATLTFTIDNTAGVSPDDDASAITFTDDLGLVLPGLVAALPPSPTPPCGVGSDLTGLPGTDGGTLLTLTGGSVAGGASCTFSVTVTVPATIPNPTPPPAGSIPTPDGSYLNLTSSLGATIDGMGVSLPPAADSLEVLSSLVELTKEFTDDPVAPGTTATLLFTLTNLSVTEMVTDIAFTDDLDAALSGLMATGAANTCGGMSPTIFPSDFFEFDGGSLAAGASCTVTVMIDVPAAPLAKAPPFLNTSSAVTGKVGALDVYGEPGEDELLIQLLAISKDFTDDPTTATATVTLEFTLSNMGTTDVTDLAFTDDLSAVLAGLVATTLPPVGICGPGSALTGTSFLTFTGGSLAAGTFCVIPVTLTVPASAMGGVFINNTSELRVMGVPVAPAASALLKIEPPPTFAKVFVPDMIGQGFNSTLTFTINNSGSAVAASDLDFLDNLPGGLEVAAAPMVSNSCGGAVVAMPGSASISLSNGTVAAGMSCTLSVNVTAVGFGTLANETSDLTSTSGNSSTATDTIVVAGCTAADGVNLTLTNGVVYVPETYEVCNTISVKQHFLVVGPDGVLTLRAGVAVIIFNGVEIGKGGRLTVEIDPGLQP